MFLIILGSIFLVVLVAMLLNVALFSLGPLLLTYWQTRLEAPAAETFDALTDKVITSLLGMAACMGGPPLLVLIAFGVWLPLWGRKTLQQDRYLQDHGQVTRAEIIDRWTRWGYRSTWHCVAYRFKALSPEDSVPHMYTFAERSYEAYRRLRVGNHAPIRYLPEDPSVCRLELSSPQH
jgi:hypothetical protein